MINLRYHIVSVVAVFLALGIGLALGSTFVDSILVNELEDQVNQLDLAQEEAAEQKDQAIADRDEEVQNNEALRAEMSALEKLQLTELADLRELHMKEREGLLDQAELERESTDALLNVIETLMPRGRLRGTAWVLLAPTGADRLVTTEIREILTRSEGEYLGTLWIRPSMNFEDVETSQVLAELYEGDIAPEEVANLTVSNLATALLADQITEDPQGPAVEGFLSRLSGLGLLSYDGYQPTTPNDELSNTANRILIINDPAHLTLHQDFFVPLIQEISDRGGSGIGAILELQKQSVPRGQVVDRIRNDSDLARMWSTFDDVDSFDGRFGFLIGLDSLPTIGHYGDLLTAEERYPR